MFTLLDFILTYCIHERTYFYIAAVLFNIVNLRRNEVIYSATNSYRKLHAMQRKDIILIKYFENAIDSFK